MQISAITPNARKFCTSSLLVRVSSYRFNNYLMTGTFVNHPTTAASAYGNSLTG